MQTTERGGASLKLEGDARLMGIFSRLSDPTERLALMEALGAYGVSSTQQRFLDEKAPDGTAWKPSLRAKEAGGKTLRMSNLLFQSLTFQADDGAAQWGTNREYAGIHQFGGDIVPKTKKALFFTLANGQKVMVKKVRMPARPFLGVSDADRARMGDIGESWLKSLVGGGA